MEYYQAFEVEDLNEFLESLKEQNILQELSDRVLEENPNIQLAEPEYNTIRFPLGEYKDKNVLIEFCDAVTDRGYHEGDYKFREQPEFLAATTLHKGPQRTMGRSYAMLYRWISQNGYSVSGLPRNSAIDGFWNKENESEYLTEIQVPVRKE